MIIFLSLVYIHTVSLIFFAKRCNKCGTMGSVENIEPKTTREVVVVEIALMSVFFAMGVVVGEIAETIEFYPTYEKGSFYYYFVKYFIIVTSTAVLDLLYMGFKRVKKYHTSIIDKKGNNK